MPMVTVRGTLSDFGQVVVPADLEPRLWFVANENWVTPGGSTLFNGEVLARWDGSVANVFEADLWSQPNDPRLWYTLRLDFLAPGQDAEPPEKRARGFFEWPHRIYPGEGGSLGDIIAQQVGLALVYASPGAPALNRWNQIHWNTSTDWVYEREVTW